MVEVKQADALRLKVLVSIAGSGFAYQPLEEHLVPQPLANTLLEAGKAELVEPKRRGKMSASRPPSS